MKKRLRLVLMLLICIVILLILPSCSTAESTVKKNNEGAPVVGDLKFDYSMDLQYANKFRVDYYEGGYALISIANNTRFLVVPEGMKAPKKLDEDIAILQQPISNIYLVATSTASLFNALDALDVIRLSGTKPDGWYIEEIAREMEKGNILYAGKYSEPDYELITSENCALSVQSGMITHAPKIKGMLEDLGVTVLIDQSSFESHPFGRTEWIKLYSVLVDKEELAEKIFDEQVKVLNKLSGIENTGKTVAFFYINSSGTVSVRNSYDYLPKMIELAGGNYIFESLGDAEKAISTTKMGMEDFYATAKDADYIIYNSTIAGSLDTMEKLLSKSELLKDFKAVQEGNVWCTEQNLFQSSEKLGSILGEINKILTTNDESLSSLEYFYKLQ